MSTAIHHRQWYFTISICTGVTKGNMRQDIRFLDPFCSRIFQRSFVRPPVSAERGRFQSLTSVRLSVRSSVRGSVAPFHFRRCSLVSAAPPTLHESPYQKGSVICYFTYRLNQWLSPKDVNCVPIFFMTCCHVL